MTVKISVVCSGCKRITRTPTNGRCPTCHREWQKTDGARRQAHPRARIYADPRWKACARAVLQRDHWSCVDCGRHISQLGENEKLGADHDPIPVMECDDPYDPDACRARCSTCSGAKDGKRAHA